MNLQQGLLPLLRQCRELHRRPQAHLFLPDIVLGGSHQAMVIDRRDEGWRIVKRDADLQSLACDWHELARPFLDAAEARGLEPMQMLHSLPRFLRRRSGRFAAVGGIPRLGTRA